jgi:hypothetical protein
MGGQACVLYGAAEFSRDTDIVILADASNIKRLSSAMRSLQAVPIAVPSLSLRCLRKGHAVHFRRHHPEASRIRVDIMSVLRDVPSFATLWRRRATVTVAPHERYDLMALPDLVRAKKTQRDKDWPMLRRFLAHAKSNFPLELEAALSAEEQRERERDRLYWEPLMRELERLRHRRPGRGMR